MKKALVLLTLVLILTLLPSCTLGNSNYTGEVVARGSMPEMFVLENKGVKYGFIITDGTELEISDEMLSLIGYIDGEDMFDYFGMDMSCDVLAGEKAPASENYISDDVAAWFYAKEIKVTDVHEEYFFAEGE